MKLNSSITVRPLIDGYYLQNYRGAEVKVMRVTQNPVLLLNREDLLIHAANNQTPAASAHLHAANSLHQVTCIPLWPIHHPSLLLSLQNNHIQE